MLGNAGSGDHSKPGRITPLSRSTVKTRLLDPLLAHSATSASKEAWESAQLLEVVAREAAAEAEPRARLRAIQLIRLNWAPHLGGAPHHSRHLALQLMLRCGKQSSASEALLCAVLPPTPASKRPRTGLPEAADGVIITSPTSGCHTLQ